LTWDKSYAHTLAYALDITGALIFWNQSDITISSLCWLVMMAEKTADYRVRLDSLKLYGWQTALLGHIGPQLDKVQPLHRELAREADLARAQKTIGLLSHS
jgi:hypothetical protein